MSIRSRLAIAVAIVLLVTLALLGTVFIRSTRAALVDQLDERLAAEATFELKEDRWGVGDRREGFRPYYKSQIGLYLFKPTGELRDDRPSGTEAEPDPPPNVSITELNSLINRNVTVGAVDGTPYLRLED